MSPTPGPIGTVRSATAVNAEIRALWARAGGVLTDGQRREYERLVVEYAEAVRRDVRPAA